MASFYGRPIPTSGLFVATSLAFVLLLVAAGGVQVKGHDCLLRGVSLTEGSLQTVRNSALFVGYKLGFVVVGGEYEFGDQRRGFLSEKKGGSKCEFFWKS